MNIIELHGYVIKYPCRNGDCHTVFYLNSRVEMSGELNGFISYYPCRKGHLGFSSLKGILPAPF
jgi:hypothetical protein